MRRLAGPATRMIIDWLLQEIVVATVYATTRNSCEAVR
jgi:hypothetical protein